jgi:hypothetical protein
VTIARLNVTNRVLIRGRSPTIAAVEHKYEQLFELSGSAANGYAANSSPRITRGLFLVLWITGFCIIARRCRLSNNDRLLSTASSSFAYRSLFASKAQVQEAFISLWL